MAKILVKNAVVQKPGFFYYIDEQGNLREVKLKRRTDYGSVARSRNKSKSSVKKTPVKKVITSKKKGDTQWK